VKKRFLIGQLARFGDCLYATTVAQQIKSDFPDSHVTWAVASAYKGILEHNPFVDDIWEIEGDFREDGWKCFEEEALRRHSRGMYDEVVLTQLIGRNWANFDGTIRSSLLRGYGRPITVPVAPVVRLSESEVRNVKRFAQGHKLEQFKNVILFECSPGSSQSSVNTGFALQVVKEITLRHPDTCFILSTPKAVMTSSAQIFDASVLTFRENAELSKYCTLLVGCSSGITWLCTSDWARKLDTIQIIDEGYGMFAGVAYDQDLWNIDCSHILEISNKAIGSLAQIIEVTLTRGFPEAKQRYHRVFRPTFHCLKPVIRQLWAHDRKAGSYKKVFLNILERNKHFRFWPLLGMFVWYFLTDPYVRRVEKFFRKRKNKG
jgi:hypothetical protein